MKCLMTARPDPAYPTNVQHVPAVRYCETHHCYVGSGGCEKQRITELEDVIIDIYKWSADPDRLSDAMNRHAEVVTDMPHFTKTT